VQFPLVVLLTLFVANWTLGMYLQHWIGRELKLLKVSNEISTCIGDTSERSLRRSFLFVKFLFSGEYRQLQHARLVRRCNVLIGCIVFQLILLGSLLGFILLDRPQG
jgi:hypothetical protein